MGTYIFPCIGAFTYVIKKQQKARSAPSLVGGILSRSIFLVIIYFLRVIILRNINITVGTKTINVDRLSNVLFREFFPLQLKHIFYFYLPVLSPLLSWNLQFKKAVASKVIHVVATMITLNCRLRCFTTSSCTWGHLHYNLHYLALCTLYIHR